MTSVTARSNRSHDAYMALVNQFPPRPIHSERQYDQTVAVIDRLAVRDEKSFSRAERDYLAALTRFVEDYDAEHFMPNDSGRSPLEVLRYLLDQNEMNASDLGRLLGSRTLGSKILRGERELSKSHIRTLADRFRVSPGLFL